MRLRSLVLAAAGAIMLAGMGSAPAFADSWHHRGWGHGGWRHHGWRHDGWRGHGWHHGWERGWRPHPRHYYSYRPPVFVPPPVYRYYGPPAYTYGYAPPVVTFGFGFN
jgi:hypothetical protein